MASSADIRSIYRAIHNADKYAIELDYTDSKGQKTRRKVRPIRRTGHDAILVMYQQREADSGQPSVDT